MAAREDDDGHHGPAGGGGAGGAALAWLAWLGICAGLWLSLIDNLHFQELVAGAVVAAIGATAALLVRAQRRIVLRPRAAWVLGMWRPVAAYPRDSALVFAELVRALFHRRRSRGRLIALPFHVGEEDPHEAARRVLMKTAGSLAPNAYVVGADEEACVLLVHQLAPRPDIRSDVDPLGLL